MLNRGRAARLTVLLFMSCFVVTIYLVYFKHPPPDELLLLNRKNYGGGRNDFGASSFGGGDYSENDGDREEDGVDFEQKEGGNEDDVDEDVTADEDENNTNVNNEDNSDDREGTGEVEEGNEEVDRQKEDGVEESKSDSVIETEVPEEKEVEKEVVSKYSHKAKETHLHIGKTSEEKKDTDATDEESSHHIMNKHIKTHSKSNSSSTEDHSHVADGRADSGHRDEDSHSASKDGSEVSGTAVWNRFLKKHNFVPIGVVYSKCEGLRQQLGTVAMLPDKVQGGVTSRTFMNITLPKEITGGQFYIEVKYNGKPLYDNYWEICEMEDDVPEVNRTFICPIRAGHWRIDKERHLPGYLPKGRFQTKAWAVDEDKSVIACGYSDFKL